MDSRPAPAQRGHPLIFENCNFLRVQIASFISNLISICIIYNCLKNTLFLNCINRLSFTGSNI